jgi:predicted membrane-bound dolichyl-phosphate-mannose-protein mannosyltransferase
MRPVQTVTFLCLSALFAITHVIAIAASLYWYYWWFDLLMHFWGGALLALGVHVLSTFSFWPFRPTTTVVLGVVFFAVVSWEVFEWYVGLFDSNTFLFETMKDMGVGVLGAVVAQLGLSRYKM